MQRTPESLRNIWSIVAYDALVYLPAQARVMKHPPGGQTEEGLKTLTMDMYCTKNKRKDADDVERMAPSFN